MAQKKSRDDAEITITIPRKTIIRYFTERYEFPGKRRYVDRAIAYIVRKALKKQYLKILEESGDTNDSRERDTSN